MPYCKLYTNFAVVFNKCKIMKQKNLRHLDDETLIYINWFCESLLNKNILSRTETQIVKNWQKQVKKEI